MNAFKKTFEMSFCCQLLNPSVDIVPKFNLDKIGMANRSSAFSAIAMPIFYTLIVPFYCGYKTTSELVNSSKHKAVVFIPALICGILRAAVSLAVSTCMLYLITGWILRLVY